MRRPTKVLDTKPELVFVNSNLLFIKFMAVECAVNYWCVWALKEIQIHSKSVYHYNGFTYTLPSLCTFLSPPCLCSCRVYLFFPPIPALSACSRCLPALLASHICQPYTDTPAYLSGWSLYSPVSFSLCLFVRLYVCLCPCSPRSLLAGFAVLGCRAGAMLSITFKASKGSQCDWMACRRRLTIPSIWLVQMRVALV